MTNRATRIAIVGCGKIARDQHVPAITADDGFELTATVDPQATPIAGVPHFPTLDALLASGLAVDCGAICTPPQYRYEVAKQALRAGLDLLLEKPPCADMAEALALERMADDRLLFAAWHSRFAPAVAPAAKWLAGRRISRVDIVWREDVRKWHPGQNWIWQQGGLGVFDPAINALSILTSLVPGTISVTGADLARPSNCAMPISGTVTLEADAVSGGITLDLDFLEPDGERWDIAITTDDAHILKLSQGGSRLSIDDVEQVVESADEYPALYRHFAELLDRRTSDFQLKPLELALSAIGHAPMHVTEPFCY